MQQPFTNSEAVKRCMTIPDAPIPGVPSYNPRPPYAANARSRPYSGLFVFIFFNPTQSSGPLIVVTEPIGAVCHQLIQNSLLTFTK